MYTVYCVCSWCTVYIVHTLSAVCSWCVHCVCCVWPVHTHCPLCATAHGAQPHSTLYCVTAVCAHVHCTVCPGAPVAHGPCAQPTRPSRCPCCLCMPTLPATHCPLCVGPVRRAMCDVAVRRCVWRPGSHGPLLSCVTVAHACAVLCAQWLLAVSNLCAGAGQPTWGSPPHKGESRAMAGVPLAPTPTLTPALSRVRSLRVPTPVCPVATHRALSMAGARPAQGSVAPPKCKSCVVAGALRGPTPT